MFAISIRCFSGQIVQNLSQPPLYFFFVNMDFNTAQSYKSIPFIALLPLALALAVFCSAIGFRTKQQTGSLLRNWRRITDYYSLLPMLSMKSFTFVCFDYSGGRKRVLQVGTSGSWGIHVGVRSR